MFTLLNLYQAILWFWMTIKYRTKQPAIPFPSIFRCRCAVDAHKAAAGLNVSFKVCLLRSIQKPVARCTQKNHSCILLQRIFSKVSRIRGGINIHLQFSAYLLQRGLSRRDGLMIIPIDFIEDKYFFG